MCGAHVCGHAWGTIHKSCVPLTSSSLICLHFRALWLVLGDFDLIRFPHEKNKTMQTLTSGGPPNLFNALINSLALLELPLSDRLFTWTNKIDPPTLARLDRAFLDVEWDSTFPESTLSSRLRTTSDHFPLGCWAPTFSLLPFPPGRTRCVAVMLLATSPRVRKLSGLQPRYGRDIIATSPPWIITVNSLLVCWISWRNIVFCLQMPAVASLPPSNGKVCSGNSEASAGRCGKATKTLASSTPLPPSGAASQQCDPCARRRQAAALLGFYFDLLALRPRSIHAPRPR